MNYSGPNGRISLEKLYQPENTNWQPIGEWKVKSKEEVPCDNEPNIPEYVKIEPVPKRTYTKQDHVAKWKKVHKRRLKKKLAKQTRK